MTKTTSITFRKTVTITIVSLLVSLLVLLSTQCAFCDEVKEIKTIKTEKHQKFFNIPMFVLPVPGFSFEKTNFGCADKAKKVTLEASQLRLPYETLLEEFSKENLKKEGLELKGHTNLLWNGSNAMLLKIFQTSKNIVLGKWVLIVDCGEKSWMLSASYDSKNQLHAASTLKMIKSVYWDDDNKKEKIVASDPIGKICTEKTDMKFAGLAQGALVYTKDGQLPTGTPDGSLLVVSNSKNSNKITPNKYLPYAKEKIKTIEPGKKLDIISENDVTIDGLPGVEIVANTKDGEERLIFLTILFDNKNIHTIVGIAKKNTAENLELFHSLCSSYKQDV
ncbi:MAG: hypothetical protein GXZ18_02375 [Synergistaceae bacterium]|nr:hypothetical protein [Synergistaceae bacterium]